MRFASQGAARGRRRPMMTIIATSLLTSACHYVDPQCLASDYGISARRQHGVLLDLQLGLERVYRKTAYTENFSLVIDGAGGVEYSELDDVLTTCRHMGQEDRAALDALWTSPDLESSGPLCGPGYLYRGFGDENTCRAGSAAGAARGSPFRPHVRMTYYGDEGPISFSWDLESQLPTELGEAVHGMLGLICEENRRLARNIRRGHPELAARAGCLGAES